MRTTVRVRSRWAAALMAAAACLTLLLTGAASAATPSVPPVATTAADPAVGAERPPVFAYFYQWYTSNSWDRAKDDYPLAGRYSSDDLSVLRNQVRQAQRAGLTGFLTSWKDTPALDRRLERLITVAAAQHFDLGVVYQALDFARKPLPIDVLQRDMQTLVARWGPGLRATGFDRPIIIWTGIEQFSRADVQRVRTALGSTALLLAAAKSVDGYEEIADLVDGEAYYWSSADPTEPSTAAKLDQMSRAVHGHHGIWFAPAASGFDGTTLGSARVIPRNDGATLRRSLNAAFRSQPDAIGVISWNEWSENTYVEPGERYGDRELSVLTSDLSRRGYPTGAPKRATSERWPGLWAAGGLAIASVIGVVIAVRTNGRRDGHPRGPDPTGLVPNQPLARLR